MGTSCSTPFSMMMAVFAPKEMSLRMASLALPRALLSKYLPVRWKEMIIAAMPEKSCARMFATTSESGATKSELSVPKAMRTSIFAAPPLMDFTAET